MTAMPERPRGIPGAKKEGYWCPRCGTDRGSWPGLYDHALEVHGVKLLQAFGKTH